LLVPGLQGLTPLLVSAKDGNAKIMRALIEAKANQTLMDREGKTAIELLLHATFVKQSNIAHAIAVSSADVNMRNSVRIVSRDEGEADVYEEGETA
jgi:hypothetical protein